MITFSTGAERLQILRTDRVNNCRLPPRGHSVRGESREEQQYQVGAENVKLSLITNQVLQLCSTQFIFLYSQLGCQKIKFCLRYQNYLHFNIKKLKKVHSQSGLWFVDKTCHCMNGPAGELRLIKICQPNESNNERI